MNYVTCDDEEFIPHSMSFPEHWKKPCNCGGAALCSTATREQVCLYALLLYFHSHANTVIPNRSETGNPFNHTLTRLST